MTPRQCEIAAEAYAASLLARCGYDVSVQYGANQPQYDLVAVKGERILLVSVKGSQDGGWMLAVKYVTTGVSYHAAIDKWRAAQRADLVFMFVQYMHTSLNEAPPVYLARPTEIALHMKTQCSGRGHGSLQEDIRRDRPRSQYDHRIPADWQFNKIRLNNL